MPFDLLTLFEEIEAALIRWDEGDERAAEAFAKRIFSLRPAYVSGTGYRLYREDAVTRYAQWILSMNRELGIVPVSRRYTNFPVCFGHLTRPP